MDDLLSIGRFARITGLTVGALRHYDELGLLAPARVDPETAYRFYRREQAADARLVARLRELDVPLHLVAAVLRAPPSDRGALLAEHRSGLQARLARLQRQLHRLDRIVDHREEIMPTTTATTATTSTTSDADEQRRLGVELFDHVWTLIEEPARTPEQDDEMLHGAHASRYHWGASGPYAEPFRLLVGEWQCARVYSVLGRAEPALWHARRAVGLAEQHGIDGFFLASSHEGLARALRVAGDHAAAERSAADARRIGESLEDPEEREILFGDLDPLRA